MNDLRNQNRTLSAVPSAIPTTEDELRPTRLRPDVPAAEADVDVDVDADAEVESHGEVAEQSNGDGAKLTFPVSREVRATAVGTAESNGDAAHDGDAEARNDAVDLEPRPRTRARRRPATAEVEAPESRPSKRREASEDEEPPEEFEPEQEQFAWYSYDEGEEGPKELKAKSPLLSRAFRSSVG